MQSSPAARSLSLPFPQRAFHWLAFALWSIACLWLLWPQQAHAQQQQQKRVALLIGNAGYQAAPLRNPPNDVREMEAALRGIGFRVQTVLNANQNQMKRAVRDFGDMAQGADIAFVYYSGHGTQANGENYLLPIGAAINKESDYEVEAVSANALMRQIAGARPKAAVVVLDACRDNPFAAVTRSTAKGLGRMDAPVGTMVAFATSPNTTASDEGHYARVLAKQLRTPGLELYDVFRNTTAEVRRLTGGKQEPRVSEVSITDRIYLAGEGVGVPVAAAQVPAPVAAPAAPPPVQVATVYATPTPAPAQAVPGSAPRSFTMSSLNDLFFGVVASVKGTYWRQGPNLVVAVEEGFLRATKRMGGQPLCGLQMGVSTWEADGKWKMQQLSEIAPLDAALAMGQELPLARTVFSVPLPAGLPLEKTRLSFAIKSPGNGGACNTSMFAHTEAGVVRW
ncbi:MAG: caspase family protein [Pseudomonadota bacterium]